jgi:heme/copper-type cytochrome/quinol oxidase subunit 2
MSMFFFTFITLSRYISIFILRNPLGYYDDFWSRFICMWVTLGTIVIQSALDFLPGKHPVNYYICTGRNPALDTNKETKIIRNYSIVVGCVVVIIVYIFVQIKIKLYEKKETQVATTVAVQDKKPLTDYLIVVSYIVFVILHVILLLKIQTLDSTKMDVFPNYMYMYYLQFWLLPNFTLMLTSLYLARSHQLREMLFREIRGFVVNFFNQQV